jgi:hypothetical protein
MVLECIPVIPPDLRPLVLLDSGNFATSDLNDLYRRIINCNNRLKKLVDLNAPEVIIRNEKRMLQQSVDALFDNNRCKRPVLGSSDRPLKSLTDLIKGKQGRFRENLVGKRVDYSGRSVIVPAPKLRLHQCGLPKKIALELFQPFIIRRLKELGHADTIKSAKKMLERKDETVWDILEEVIKNRPVLLNRPPTLSRTGIQAFEAVLVEGNAICLSPLVCKGFNADFDGDQMAVHLPLSIEAQVEATVLMMSTNNIFSPANGQPIIGPSQDVVMGCYYLTATRGEPDEAVEPGDGMVFSGPGEVVFAHSLGKVGVHARIRVRLLAKRRVVSTVKLDGERAGVEEIPRAPNGLVSTTVGRVLFDDILPTRADEGGKRMPFYDLAMSSEQLARVVRDCYGMLGRAEAIDLLDRMKVLGFHEATRSGLSLSMDDLRTSLDARVVNEGAMMTATQTAIISGLEQALAGLPALKEHQERLSEWEATLAEAHRRMEGAALKIEQRQREAERLLAELRERKESVERQERSLLDRTSAIERREASFREREVAAGRREATIRAWLRDGDRREKALRGQEEEFARREAEAEQRLRSRAEQVAQAEQRVREAERHHEARLEREAADLRAQKGVVEKARLDLEGRRRALEDLEAALRDRESKARRREAALNGWEERLRQQGPLPPTVNVQHAGPPRRLVTVPGKLYSRPASATGVAWGFRSHTPGSVPLDDDQLYCLCVSRAATDQDLAGLTDLVDLYRLSNLQLEGCSRVTDAGLASVAALVNLRLLVLEGCAQITDAGLAHLGGLAHLSWLNLAGCNQITDGGLARLAPLVSLQVLILDRCRQVTDRGIAHLHGLPSLRRIDLHGLPKAGVLKGLLGGRGVTSAGVAALKAARPGCEIKGLGQ